MVSFASQPESEPDIEDSQPKTPFSFTDSFLDFDTVQFWLQDKPSPIMATPENNNNNGVATVEVKVETPKCQTLGASCCAVEEGVLKTGSVGGCEISVAILGNGEIKCETMTGNQSENAIKSFSSSSSSSSSTSCDSSSCSSSSSSDSDDDSEDEKGEGRANQHHVSDAEVEEGEMRDSEGQEMVTESDSSEDGEEMTCWNAVDDDLGVGDDDDEDGNNATGGPIRSKNELENLPPVPPVNVTLEPHHQMLPVGSVMSLIGAQVIVEGVEKHDPLNEGSILWMTESRKPLGLIDEIFGPVRNPYYVVRYNSEKEVPTGIRVGTSISFVPEFADHVLNNKDLYKKGYDASGVNDEELFDGAEFSDDEKEAEYKRMQRVTKSGVNDQKPGKRKNNRRKVSQKEPVVPTLPVASAGPLLDHGQCSRYSGDGQGLFAATAVVPPFLPPNAGPNLTTSGVWTNGMTVPQQPLSALPPNGFPTNGISWYPENTQIPYQMLVPAIPFQQPLHPGQISLSTTMLPGVQPNILAQPMYAQGFVGQNQMPFGLGLSFSQIQPAICDAQQGFLSSELQSERNSHLHSSTIAGNHHAPPQFHPGASASRGRKTFHGGGRKGWRPPK